MECGQWDWATITRFHPRGGGVTVVATGKIERTDFIHRSMANGLKVVNSRFVSNCPSRPIPEYRCSVVVVSKLRVTILGPRRALDKPTHGRDSHSTASNDGQARKRR